MRHFAICLRSRPSFFHDQARLGGVQAPVEPGRGIWLEPDNGMDLQEKAEEAEREQPAAPSDRKEMSPASTLEILQPPWPLFPPVNGLRCSGLTRARREPGCFCQGKCASHAEVVLGGNCSASAWKTGDSSASPWRFIRRWRWRRRKNAGDSRSTGPLSIGRSLTRTSGGRDSGGGTGA